MVDSIRVITALQSTLDNLSYLSSIKNNQKCFFSERSYVSASEWSMARARRYFKNETLVHQIPIIRSIIDMSLEWFRILSDNTHYHATQLQRLISLFTKARDGIINLKNTYTLEGANTIELDNIIYTMNAQLSQFPSEQPPNDPIPLPLTTVSGPIPVPTVISCSSSEADSIPHSPLISGNYSPLMSDRK